MATKKTKKFGNGGAAKKPFPAMSGRSLTIPLDAPKPAARRGSGPTAAERAASRKQNESLKKTKVTKQEAKVIGSANRSEGPGYKKGGKVKKYAAGSQVDTSAMMAKANRDIESMKANAAKFAPKAGDKKMTGVSTSAQRNAAYRSRMAAAKAARAAAQTTKPIRPSAPMPPQTVKPIRPSAPMPPQTVKPVSPGGLSTSDPRLRTQTVKPVSPGGLSTSDPRLRTQTVKPVALGDDARRAPGQVAPTREAMDKTYADFVSQRNMGSQTPPPAPTQSQMQSQMGSTGRPTVGAINQVAGTPMKKGGKVVKKATKAGRALVKKSADTMGRAMKMNKGGKCYAKGGSIDGIAKKGKTKGKMC